MKIRNIVFDIGRVLVGFDPLSYLCSLGFSASKAHDLYQIIFGETWKSYDHGDFESILAYEDMLVRAHPKYANEIRAVFLGDWVKMHTPRSECTSYLKSLKNDGYHIFLLSNMGPDSFAYVSTLDFFHEIEGGVFSYQEYTCKPEERIYRILLDRYSLHPAETIFIDDSIENIAVANRIGIQGIVFTDLDTVKAYVNALLKKT